MVDKINDGGPAFPCTTAQECPSGRWADVAYPGMSVRDWFAGQALAGMTASSVRVMGPGEIMRDELSRLAYAQADSMLKARGT